MNILVLLKQVPDTESRLRIVPEKLDIDRSELNMVINPYDEYAIEEALRARDQQGGNVVIITMGSQKAEEAVRTALAMGADRAIRVDTTDFPAADPAATALILSKVIATEQFDLVLTGRQAIDDDSAQVGPFLAHYLGVPVVTAAFKFEVDGNRVCATKEIEGGSQETELATPCLITISKGLNEPRYPSLPGIMKAKRKELKVVSLADLGLSPDTAELASPRTTRTGISMPTERKAGRMFTGEPESVIPEVVKLLKEEAKVI